TILSIGPGIAASVDEQILPGNETGMLRAEKRAIGAELVWPAVAFGGIGLGASAPQLLECFAGPLQHCADMHALRVAVETPRQEIVMVTLRETVCRASPATKPTRPERAPFES